MAKKPAKVGKKYASQKRYEKYMQDLVRDTCVGDWADFKPRRDVGVYANERTTFRHNGETKWT